MPFISDQAIARVQASMGIFQKEKESAQKRLALLRPRTAGRVTIGDDVVVRPEIGTRSIVVAGECRDDRELVARVFATELWARKYTVVFVDTTGCLWKLKAAVNGRWVGVRLSVMGGEHADYALTGDAGEEIAAWIAGGTDPARSCILDVSTLPQNERDGLVGAFIDGLRRRRRTQSVHLIVDDGELWVPSQVDSDKQKASVAIQKVFADSLGLRVGITLMTGHPELLSQDLVAGASALMLLHTSDPEHRSAIKLWLSDYERSQIREVLASLPTLPAGAAWFASPEWLRRVRKMVHLREPWR